MTPDKWDELVELFCHAVLGCVLILLACWGLVLVLE